MDKSINSKKTKNPFKLIPWWGWVGGIIFFLCHAILYFVTSAVVKIYGPNFILSWSPKWDVVDNNIPFVPYFFSQMYYVSYLVFFVVPIVVSLTGKKNFINYMICGVSTYILSAIIFLVFPSWQDRVADQLLLQDGSPGLLIQNIKTPFTKWMMTIIVGNDGGTTAWNMAPSFHILSALFCALGTIRKKEIHVSFRISNYILNFIILLTVLFVRQHYILDLIMALLLGGAAYLIVFACNPGNKILTKNPNFLEHKKQKSKK